MLLRQASQAHIRQMNKGSNDRSNDINLLSFSNTVQDKLTGSLEFRSSSINIAAIWLIRSKLPRNSSYSPFEPADTRMDTAAIKCTKGATKADTSVDSDTSITRVVRDCSCASSDTVRGCSNLPQVRRTYLRTRNSGAVFAPQSSKQTRQRSH